MKITKGGTPIGGPDGLDSSELKDARGIKEGKEVLSSFLDTLESKIEGEAPAESAGDTAANSEVKSMLATIARSNNLSSPESARAAISEAASFLVESRLTEKMKPKDRKRLKDELASFISKDIYLSQKIYGILSRLKE